MDGNYVSINRSVVTCKKQKGERTAIVHRGACKQCPFHQDIRCPN